MGQLQHGLVRAGRLCSEGQAAGVLVFHLQAPSHIPNAPIPACAQAATAAQQSGEGSAAQLAADKAAADAAAQRNAAEVQRLRAELAHLQVPGGDASLCVSCTLW